MHRKRMLSWLDGLGEGKRKWPCHVDRWPYAARGSFAIPGAEYISTDFQRENPEHICFRNPLAWWSCPTNNNERKNENSSQDLYLILSGVPICLAEFSAGQIEIRRMQKGIDPHTRWHVSNWHRNWYVFFLTSAQSRLSHGYFLLPGGWNTLCGSPTHSHCHWLIHLSLIFALASLLFRMLPTLRIHLFASIHCYCISPTSWSWCPAPVVVTKLHWIIFSLSFSSSFSFSFHSTNSLGLFSHPMHHLPHV